VFLAANSVGFTGSSAAWTAIATVMGTVVVLGAVGIRLVANFARLTVSVERLNQNIEKITAQIGSHEHRLSMLEGAEKSRSYREDGVHLTQLDKD
jgi:hypothetical protein